MKINFLSILIIFSVFLNAQSYFSSIVPLENYENGAVQESMGGSGLINFSAHSEFDSLFLFSLDMNFNNISERRSFAVIDMFEDVVTQNDYVLNRSFFSSSRWTFGFNLKKWTPIPIFISFSQAPYWDLRYKYEEEIRGSLGSGIYNRDPVVGYHLYNIDGIINARKFNIASKINKKIKIGFGFSQTQSTLITQEIGALVLEMNEALSSDTTNVNNYKLNANNSLRYNLSSIFSISSKLNIGFEYKSSFDIIFNTNGFIPGKSQKTLLPNLVLSDSLVSYTISSPSHINIGFTSILNNDIKSSLSANIIYTDWEKVDKVFIDNIDTLDYNYNSAWTLQLGVEHFILQKTPFRFGFTHQGSPFGQEFERTKFSLGTGWKWGNTNLDLTAVFTGQEYQYPDIFILNGQDSESLDTVDESRVLIKLSLNYKL